MNQEETKNQEGAKNDRMDVKNDRMDVKNDRESVKNDRRDGKLRWELLPLPLLEEVVKVYTFGAEKYEANSWQNLPDGYNRYKAAMLRHLVAYEKGETTDPESGLPHLAHMAWNALAVLHCSKTRYIHIKK